MNPPESVLVLRFSAVGDVVLTAPARTRKGASDVSLQLASGTRKVSTSACCPRMHACDTPSVSTIQAENGAKEISRKPSALSRKDGVSFIQLWKRRMARS